jgi:hypothetical protein
MRSAKGGIPHEERIRHHVFICITHCFKTIFNVIKNEEVDDSVQIVVQCEMIVYDA